MEVVLARLGLVPSQWEMMEEYFFSGVVVSGTGDINPGPGVVNVSGGILGCLDKEGNFLWGGGLINVPGITRVKVRSNGDPVFAGNVFNNNGASVDLDYGTGVASYQAGNSGVRYGVVLLQYSANGVFQNYLIPSTSPPLQTPLVKGAPTNFVEDAIISDFELDNVGNYYVSVNMPWYVQSGTNFNLQGKESILLRWNSVGTYISSAVLTNTVTTGFNVWNLAPDNNGNLFIAGTMVGSMDFDPGAGNVTLNACFVANNAGFVWKLDTAFNYKGVVKIQNNTTPCSSMPNTEKSNAYDVAVNGADVYVVGNWTGTIDFDPGAGVQNVASVGGNDIYLLKLDTSLTYQSHVAYGGALSATDEYGGRVFVNRSREIVMGNLYNSDIPDINPDAGTAAVTLNGGQDGLLVKYYECGVNPIITTQPLTQTVCEGATLVLNVEAPGTATTYQWRKNSNNINGANSNVYTMPSVATGDAGNYSVVVGNLCNSTTVTSTAAVVTVTTTPAPTGAATQTFCNSARVDSLVATGTVVKWYTTTTGGTALAGTIALVNGTTYYATQTLNGCESENRLAVSVIINAPPAPSGTALQTLCSGSTLANFVLTGTNVKFYTTNTGGSPLLTSTLIVNNQSYWTSQTINGCESATRFAVAANIVTVAAPTGSATQNFCGTPTVASLVVSGTNIKWYATSTGGTPLVNTTPLVNGTIYYATQTGANSCESLNRLAVTANIFSCENALHCDGTNDQVSLPAPINNSISTLGTLEAWIKTSNAGSGFRALVVRPNFYGLFLNNNQLMTFNWSANGTTGATTYTGATLNDNQWHHVVLTFQVGVTNGTQLYLDGQPVGNPITHFLSNASANFALGANTNTQFYAGLLDRVKIWGRALTAQEVNDSYNCLAVTSTNLITNYNFNQGFPSQNNAGVTTLTDEVLPAENGTLSGFALNGTTSNWVSGYTCTPNLCPAPTGASSQTFCTGASVANLVANGTNIQWYSASSSGSPLPTSTVLTTATVYYATQTANGCESANRLAVTVTINATPNAAIAPATVSICSGQSASLTASGGGTYTWSNSGGSNAIATFSPTTNTTYTVTVTGANTCTATASRLVTVNANPIASITPATITICNGQSTTLTASGGGTYTWSNGGGSNAQASISPTTNTTYTVTVTNASNCTATTSRLVTVNANPTATITPATVAICNGQSATLTASGGTQYTWSNSGGSNAAATFSPTANTTYTVTVTNAASCSATASRLVTVNANPTAAIAPTAVAICNGQSTTLTASGGTSYAWSNSGGSNASASFSPTANTTYTVTVTNASNCTATTSRLVTVNANPTAAITPATVAICNGQSTTLTASGGTSYAWSNSGGSNAAATFSPTANTTYTVTVTNASNCTATASRLVTVNAIPTATINGPTTICSGLQATLTASGGGTYVWSGGLGSNAAINVTPTSNTTYTVTVTGTGNCTATASQTVTVQTSPTATISGADSICIGNSVTLTANGGNTYSWNAGLGSNAAITVSPTTTTTYTVTVSIGANCSATTSKTIKVNQNPTAGVTPASATICSGQSQTFTASGSGAYTWSNSGGSLAAATFSPNITTTYTVTVTNAASCTATASGSVVVNQTPTASITPATVTICNGESATLTSAGGGTYTWSNGGGSTAAATFSPTTTTTYTVTVSNANNCTATATRSVTVNAVPTAAINPATASICNGQSQTLSASGGGTYAWSNSLGAGATKSVSPTATTTYTVTVTNAANCTATATSTITVNTVTAAINGPSTICSGLPATLTASGGTSYAWSNGQNSAAITVIPATTTTYTVTVTGAGNCTATASQTVSVQSAPTATITGASAICNGASTTLTANGGNTYTWANGLGANAVITVNPTQTTTYTVTVSIGTNCTASATKTLTVNQPTTSTRNQTICQGASVSFKGQTLTTAGTYRDTLMNAAGCDSVITLTLTVTPAIQRQLSETICFGASTTFNGQTLSQAGTYRDTTQTAQGCDSITTLVLNISNRAQSTLNAGICAGQSYSFRGQSLTQAGQYLDTVQTTAGCDSFITLNLSVNSFVTGTTTKAICQGESFTFNGQSLTQAGQYRDTLTSAGGCDSILTLTLTVNSLPTPTITQSGANLSTQTFANYNWLFNSATVATTQSYTATANGSYTVEVTDANGCKNTSAAVQVTGLSIENTRNDLKVSIYPNPANEVLNIEVESNEFTLTITDIAGRRMMIAENQKAITLSQLASGVYNIEIKTENGIARKQFIKE
jgi:hypothetical protein